MMPRVPSSWATVCLVPLLSCFHPAIAEARQEIELDLDSMVKFTELDYVIKPKFLREMCALMPLTERELEAVNEAYLHYWPAAMSLDVQAAEAMSDAGYEKWKACEQELSNLMLNSMRPGSESPDDVAKRLQLEETVGQLWHAVELAKWPYLSQSDQLVVEFFLLCESVGAVDETQRREMERYMRRRLLLPRASQSNGAFRLTVNLHDLTHDVFTLSGDLVDVRLDAEHRRLLNDAVERYDASLDLFLSSDLARERRPPKLRKAVYRPSDPEWDDMQKESAETARRLGRIQLSLIEEVHAVLIDIDPEAAEDWKTIAYSKMCPSLYREFITMTLDEWLAEHGLPQEILEQVVILAREFRSKHIQLCAAAFESGIDTEFHLDSRLFGAGGGTRRNLRHTRDLFAIHVNGRDYILRLIGLLDAGQRDIFRRYLMRKNGTVIRFGPPLHAGYLEKLKLSDKYDAISSGSFLD